MSVKQIITVPNPLLRQPSKPVNKPGPEIKKLINDLLDTLQSTKEVRGVGLSAVQIGVPLKVIVIFIGRRVYVPMINPEITWRGKKSLLKSKRRLSPIEGCLSVPGIWGTVRRNHDIRVSFLDDDGRKLTKKLSGLSAKILQHEIDHTNGILFIDRVLEQKGKLYKIEKNEEGKEELVELTESINH